MADKLGRSYTTSNTENLYASVGSDVTYRSSTSAFLGNHPALYIKPYTTIDLRAGIVSKSKKWTVSIYGNNVTNVYYWTSVNRGSDTIFRYAARPVTYGLYPLGSIEAT